MEKAFFEITGMHCASCQARIETALSQMDGIEKTQVNLLKNQALVIFHPNTITEEDIIQKIIETGYQAMRQHQPAARPKTQDLWLKWRLIVSLIFTAPLFYLAMGTMLDLPVPTFLNSHHTSIASGVIQAGLILPVILVNLSYFHHGLRSLFRRSPTMDTLIAVGSGAAILYSSVIVFQQLGVFPTFEHSVSLHNDLYFESAAVILTLVTLGAYFEAKAKGKTSETIIKLMHLAPKTVTKREGELEHTMALEHILPGDVLVVKAGEIIPADGIMIEGHGVLDESTLTGEPLPVEKNVGQRIIGSTLNQSGYFLMKVTETGANTIISQIIRLVDEATSSKAPISRIADNVSKIFVPCVIGVAFLALMLWLLVGASFPFALSIGISVLVISCPCALGLATPTAIMVGTGQGALQGILFKSAQALETIQNVDVVVLDKTGTLTTGKPSVTDYLVHTGSVLSLLQFAASLERYSEHPLANAILGESEKQQIPLFPVTQYQAIAGQGISGNIDDLRFFVGNQILMEAQNIKIPPDIVTKADSFAEQGKTALFVANATMLLGVIALADPIKPHSFEAISRLKHLGMSVIMLTGDNHITAKAIQQKAGIQSVIAGVLPMEKEHHIRLLQEKGHHVAMVGDGINDAPALARADVGLAIGVGTDIAMEAADIVLIKSDLQDIVVAIELSHAVYRVIKQNLFWAFIYNIIGIPIAAGCFYALWGLTLNPMIAALAMSFSSLSVVLNALRLKRFKPKIANKSVAGDMPSHPPCNAIRSQRQGAMPGEKTTKYLLIEGMTCRRCQHHVMTALLTIPNVIEVNVDLRSKMATLIAHTVEDAALQDAVAGAGYRVIEIK